jgi:hypothetical protein
MYYGYNSDSRKFYLPENAVEVDTVNNLLRINVIRNDCWEKEAISHEFPLLRYSTCQECDSVVSVYAVGSTDALEKAHGDDLFPKPWGRGSGWRLLKLRDGFALIASDGHDFELDKHKTLEPRCHCRLRKLASTGSDSYQPETFSKGGQDGRQKADCA